MPEDRPRFDELVYRRPDDSADHHIKVTAIYISSDVIHTVFRYVNNTIISLYLWLFRGFKLFYQNGRVISNLSSKRSIKMRRAGDVAFKKRILTPTSLHRITPYNLVICAHLEV